MLYKIARFLSETGKIQHVPVALVKAVDEEVKEDKINFKRIVITGS